MPPISSPIPNYRDAFILAPEIVLAVWGLVVLMADVGWFRKRSSAERRGAAGTLTFVGVILAFVATLLPVLLRSGMLGTTLNLAGLVHTDDPDPAVFFGTIASDVLTEWFNLLYVVLLALVVGLSVSWSFTEDWGEFFALLLWSTVGMMLLTAAEELLTLFLTLETMTICLYLCTAFEKDRRRSAEGGLKYFVYGSVSSALFLFGLSMIYGLTGTTWLYAIRFAFQPATENDAAGLANNIAHATAVLLLLVGFGFKIAAVPFHQWAPDAYEGAPAPITAWIATGSKLASFVALMKVLLYALGPWASGSTSPVSPGWIGIVVVLSAASMTYGNFAALAQRNLKRMLAYSSIAHAGYMLVGVAAAGLSAEHEQSAGSVLYYLVVYAFSNIGAFAVAAWLARDLKTDNIDDLNGLGFKYPGLATCILLLMLSLIGMPPLAGFFGKFYMFAEALREKNQGHLVLLWLVGLGLLNSVVSAFYYVRVLKAMFLRPPNAMTLAAPSTAVTVPITVATVVVLGFGIYPAPLVEAMRGAAVPMLSVSGAVTRDGMSRALEIRRNMNPTASVFDAEQEYFNTPATPGATPTPPVPQNPPSNTAPFGRGGVRYDRDMKGEPGRGGPAPKKNDEPSSKKDEPPAKKGETPARKTDASTKAP
jgi:NADH-quinone oxidoreductase subunit N